MEVAASLPNVLKVFPLRIMAREDFPALQQVAFPPDASANADEEMEDGEIGLEDTCGNEVAHGLQRGKQYTGSFIQEAKSANATSAAPISPLLSLPTNNLQLEHSVDALLSPPNGPFSQGQSKHHMEQNALKAPLGNQPRAFMRTSGLPSLNQAEADIVLHAPLPAKQLPSPSKLSTAASQPLPLKEAQGCFSSLLSCSSKQMEDPSLCKKSQVLSPLAKPSHSSLTLDNQLEGSPPVKSLVLHANQPQPSSPAGNISFFDQTTYFHQVTSALKPVCADSEPQTILAGANELPGLPQSHIQAFSPWKHDFEVSSLPIHSHSPGHVSETKPQVGQRLKGVEPSLYGSAVMTEGDGKRAFITCVDGNKRQRSSAVRDYPDGCGKNLPLKADKLKGECGKDTVRHAQTVFKCNDRPDCGFMSPNTQARKDKKLGPSQEVNPQCPARMMEDKASLCPHKSVKTNTQKVPITLKRKHDASSPPGSLLRLTLKKPKVQSISCLLNPAEKNVSPPCLQGRNLEIDWLPDNHYDLTASADTVTKLQDGKYHQARPLSRGVKFAKKSQVVSEEIFKLLPTEVNSGASARSLVKKTLQEFDCVRRSLAMSKERHQRPDLTAAKILKNKGRWRNCGTGKIIGDVPGVEVGDQFSFRIEMLVIGLHRQVQGGIDYIAGSVRREGPLATSIVASGGYEDDDDCGDTFIYTGQGGNNYKGDRRQACDQVLERGNLALSNSCKEKTPVRVIRGSTDDKFYTYDGLYDVIDCWFQTGAAGFGVYQYKLSRRLGQPELGSSIVRFVGAVKKNGLARPHVLIGDLSHGKENLPICVVNEVDEEGAPQHFSYIPKMKYPSWYCPEISKGCDCVGGCVDASKCLCAAKNGGEFPYNEFGQIIRDKKVVFECGRFCACSGSCHNRVSQRGPKHQLEVFKTRRRGWGVRSLEPIRPGDFICEYVGELLSDADAEQRIERDEYLFDIGNKTGAWSGVSDLIDVAKEKAIVPMVEDVGYTIDARLFGSIARFINHSCSPNLFAQNVVYDTDDLRFPHVMLFSMENIPPMREFSYDYNYTIGHVRDANGNVKSKACYCSAQDCRGRLY